MVKILAALEAALSVLNSSGASPDATRKVAALVARSSCSGASHNSAYNDKIDLCQYQHDNIIVDIHSYEAAAIINDILRLQLMTYTGCN